MHRQFTRQVKDFASKKSWQWLKRGCLKDQTESLLIAAQDQALGTNYRKARIERTRKSAKCRMCKEKVQPLLDYFEDTFIGRRQRRGRRAPFFSHIMWKWKDRVKNDLPRTNIHVEGWHRHMQASVSAYHTNICQFIRVLKRELALNEVKQARMTAGEKPPSQKSKCVAVTNRLSTLVKEFENRGQLEYLRSIAQNLQL